MTSANRRRFGVLTVPALVIGLAACGSPPTAAGLVSEGLRAQLAGDDLTAESTYQQAIKLDPNNAVAHYDLGTVYDKQGKTSEAVAQYTAAVIVDPSFPDAMFNLAVDTAGSDPLGAEAFYLKVIAVQPGFAAAWLNVGFILHGQGKLAEANADWAKAVTLEPSLASRLPVATPSPAAHP